MIDSIVKIFETLVTNFTWRRLFHVLLVIGLLYGCLLVYDNFTGTFTLGRLQRSTELLAKLHSIQASGSSLSPELAAVHESIRNELMSKLGLAIGKPATSGALRFWLKFIAAGLPWSIIAFFTVRNTQRKGENLQNMLIGVMAVILLFSAVGGIIPTVGWPWFNLFVYPFLQFVVIIFPIAIPSFLKARETARANQAEANKTIDGADA